jgi:ABC-type Fe3+-siderophore transport system, permease component
MQPDQTGETSKQYQKFTKRKTLFLLFGILLLFLVILIALYVGAADLSFRDFLSALFSPLFPNSGVSLYNQTVIWNLRMPRIAMGVICGVGLAIAGAQMQGITRNPLVSPFTLGISSAAALGASLMIMLGIGFFGSGTLIIIAAAFGFAMLSAIVVFGFARIKSVSPETIILAGIALSYFFAALTSVIQFFASEQQLMAMVHWTFGTFTGVSWTDVGVVSIVVCACVPLFMKYSWDLNAMAAGGDDTAKALGVNVSRVRTVSLLLSAFITATIVSFTGIIGFVDLVAPHITRYVVGGDHRFLLPGSCIFGAVLTVAADTVGRTLLSPIILPISIVVSFVGVPLFLYFLVSRKQDYWRK